jgi:hypothetical protein
MSAEVYPIRPPVPIDQDELERLEHQAAENASRYGSAPDYEPHDGGSQPEPDPESEPEDRPLPWFKVPNSVMKSLAYRRLTQKARSTLFDLWSFASSEGTGGRIPDHSELKTIFNISTKEAARHYEELRKAEFIAYGDGGGYVIVDWKKTQGKRDFSTGRTAKHKAKL